MLFSARFREEHRPHATAFGGPEGLNTRVAIGRRRALSLWAAGIAFAALGGCGPGQPKPETSAAETPTGTPATGASAKASSTPFAPVAKKLNSATASPVATLFATPTPGAPTATPSPTATATSAPTPTALPTATPTPRPVSPLSGLSNQPGIVSRRPLAVKIPNDPGSLPHRGIGQAEVVFEHETEGGITRFTALFVLSDLSKVGPVRSARLVDIDLVREYSALLAHVGGSPGVRERLKALGPQDMDEFFFGAGGPFMRSQDRQAPHNAYVDLVKLRQAGADRGNSATVDLDPWDFYKAPPKQGEVHAVTVPHPSDSSTYRSRYLYDPEFRHYLRWAHDDKYVDDLDGRHVRLENVIVQFTRVTATDIEEDFLGNRSLAIETVGEGRALVFHDGHAFEGKWVRPSPTARTRFLDGSGAHIELRPGHTWVHLLRENQRVMMSRG